VKSKKLRFMILLLTAITIAVTGCAPPVVQKKEINIVWPLPPEEPRIKFVRFIRSTDDIGKELSFSDSVFGDEAASGFAKPYGVVVDKKGVIHVSDIGAVWAIDIENHDYSFIGDKPGAGRLRIPLALATSADGRLFVSDLASDRVFVFSDGRNIGALGQEGKFISVSGIAIDDERKLIYVCDSNKHNVFVYSLEDYSELRTLGERGHDEGNFNFPTNIALDSSGNLYVVDTGNFRVQIFDHEGNLVRTFGQLGDLPGTFTRPKGIALDSEDNIYVVDAAFQNVQIWNKEGQYLMAFGEGGEDPGQFSLPAGMAIDHEDKIYVVEQISRRVQIFQYLSEKWKQRQKEVEKNVGENRAE
jgi:DNA-binding beta-propeller fold protein YncE